MKFYTGDQFPADYKNNIILTEHGSWSRHQFQGGQLMRITTDPDGPPGKTLSSTSSRTRYAPNDPFLASHHAGLGRGTTDDGFGWIHEIEPQTDTPIQFAPITGSRSRHPMVLERAHAR
jgi:hypothetical protein